MRVCEGCRREYVPKAGKQRYCSLTCSSRPDAKPGYTFVPKAGEVRHCDYCSTVFVPRAPNQRFCCESRRRLARRPIEQTLYDRDNKRRRAIWAPLVASGGVTCS